MASNQPKRPALTFRVPIPYARPRVSADMTGVGCAVAASVIVLQLYTRLEPLYNFLPCLKP